MTANILNPVALWQFAALMCLAFLVCFFLLMVTFAKLRREKRGRRHAIDESLERSRSVLRGQVSENFAPLLPGFPFNHKDARFLGQPVDFLVFDGLSDSDGQADVSLYFVEIKTGNSALSKREQAVRNAVIQNRVHWLTLRQDSHGQLIPEPDNSSS